jgi:hypothetical protein
MSSLSWSSYWSGSHRFPLKPTIYNSKQYVWNCIYRVSIKSSPDYKHFLQENQGKTLCSPCTLSLKETVRILYKI